MDNKIIKKETGSDPDQMEFEFSGSGLDIDMPKYYISKGVRSDRIPEVGPEMKNLIKDMLYFPGIESFCIEPERITITKGKAFDWAFIESRMRFLFEGHKIGDVSLLSNKSLEPKFNIIIEKAEEDAREKTYHTNLLISESDHEAFEQYGWKHYELYLKEHGGYRMGDPIQRIGGCGISVLDQLFKKCGGGIEVVVIMPYKLRVKKNIFEKWDIIDEAVIGAINNAKSPLEWGHNLFR